MERGETIDNAKQSFINAGYKPTEVESAVQKMPQVASQVSNQTVSPAETPTTKLPVQSQGAIPPIPQEKKKLSKRFKIILGVVFTVILIVAAVVGLFWNKIF